MTIDCTACQEAFEYNPGVKGKNADLTKLLFVANRSDRRALEPTLFNNYEMALQRSQTGIIIQEILSFCNISWDEIYFTNLFKCLLPADRKPAPKEYQNCISLLERQIKEFEPRKILFFGKMAYERMFPKSEFDYEKAVGQVMDFEGIPSLASYHPARMWLFSQTIRRLHYQSIFDFIKP